MTPIHTIYGEWNDRPRFDGRRCQVSLHFTRCASISLLQPFDCIDLPISARLLLRIVGFRGVLR